MVDGLLVAQSDPGEATGAHNQRNAESTRVFGAAEGRPDRVHFPTDSQAVLLYHVLVAGQVDLPLILSLSDVGEQVAWNGFLVQRDISRAFKRSLNSWHEITHRGRLWSPDAKANRTVQDAKIEAVQNLARLRSGYAPANRATDSVPALVDLFDTFAPERSRAMLDTLRRVADRTGGALPRQLPTLPPRAGRRTRCRYTFRVCFLPGVTARASAAATRSGMAFHAPDYNIHYRRRAGHSFPGFRSSRRFQGRFPMKPPSVRLSRRLHSPG